MDTPLTPSGSIQRCLAAVAFANVADFSKLMESDDAQAILQWKALRQNLLEPKIAEHGCGRYVCHARRAT